MTKWEQLHAPVQYILDEDLQKNTMKLFGACKCAHVTRALAHQSQEMTVSHWPITMIDTGGES